MYEQTLVTVLKDYIKPKILKRLNRYKKWEYGYNEEHNLVVISKTGQIGEVYEIQGIKIALPKEDNVIKFEGSTSGDYTEYPKELSKIKSVFDWDEYPSLNLKRKWYDYIDTEFKRREEGFWFFNKDKPSYITGTHYMYLQWSKIDVGGKQTLGNQTDYSTYSGKLVKQMYGVTECVILKTDGQVSLSWHQARRLIRQQYPQIHDLAFYQSPGQTPKRCLLIRSYPSQLITPFSSNPSRTVWTGRRQNSRTGYQRPNLPEKSLTPMRSYRKSPVSIQRSTGRTPGTTRTMVKN
jgi:hypothetical protein